MATGKQFSSSFAQASLHHSHSCSGEHPYAQIMESRWVNEFNYDLCLVRPTDREMTATEDSVLYRRFQEKEYTPHHRDPKWKPR